MRHGKFSECASDNSFGPGIQGCRGDFDFTIKFQKIFLSIVPSAVFVALSVTRIVYLARRRERIVAGKAFQYVKFVGTAIQISTGCKVGRSIVDGAVTKWCE